MERELLRVSCKRGSDLELSCLGSRSNLLAGGLPSEGLNHGRQADLHILWAIEACGLMEAEESRMGLGFEQPPTCPLADATQEPLYSRGLAEGVGTVEGGGLEAAVLLHR